VSDRPRRRSLVTITILVQRSSKLFALWRPRACSPLGIQPIRANTVSERRSIASITRRHVSS
jgi:hypothetical protein